MGVQVARDVAELLGLLERVVHILDQNELKRDHAAVSLGEGADRRDELGEWIRLVDRHDLLAHGIGRAVQRNRQPESEVFFGEPDDLRYESAGGDRNAARPKTQTPVGVEDGEGADQLVVVGQRLAHAHDDDVVERGQLHAGARRAGVLAVAHLQQLRDDLTGVEIALEAGESARTENASHRATHLRGDANGFPGMLHAHTFLRHPDDHGFDQGSVAEFQQEFVGDVLGLLVEHQRGRHQLERVREQRTQGS